MVGEDLQCVRLRRQESGAGANPIGRRHLRCEELESRTLLSICTWIGAGATNRASDPNNWSITGGTNTIPQTGDSLVFDAATPIAVNNDLPAGIEADVIDINPGSGGSITITGNSFALPDGGTISLDSGSATIGVGITLEGGVSAVVNPGSALTLSGIISEGILGSGSLDLTGGGTLVLSAANSFTGGTEIQGKSQMTLAGGDNRLAAGGDIDIDAGTLDLADTRRRSPELSVSPTTSLLIPIRTLFRTAPSSSTIRAPSKASTALRAPARSAPTSSCKAARRPRSGRFIGPTR